jgi:RNA recognition motif-containing protein
MSTTLYVGNLPWSLSEAELAESFGQVGAVNAARIITDRETGRSRGFGFVELECDPTSAIEKMNGCELKGRQIIVNEARPRPDRP